MLVSVGVTLIALGVVLVMTGTIVGAAIGGLALGAGGGTVSWLKRERSE